MAGDTIKREALSRIADYQKNHKPCYISFEKNSIYNWAIHNAYETVLKSNDAPLDTLDKLLSKYDQWTHSRNLHANKSKQREHFSVALCAIDDLIDMLLSS